jgi:hypothetical protein
MNFWDTFEKASCLPYKCQCEAAQDALIRQPSAFLSSFAYLVAAVALFRHIKTKSTELKLWTLVCVVMGLSSLFGHMSFIRLALAIDFSSIVFLLSFFWFWNLLVRLEAPVVKMLLVFGIFYVGVVQMMYEFDKITKISTCLLIFAFSLWEVMTKARSRVLSKRSLYICFTSLFVSFGFFLLDEFHVNCHPDSFWQFHSLWHLGSALAIFFYGKWRFEEIQPRTK